jgi:hypothetical protein
LWADLLNREKPKTASKVIFMWLFLRARTSDHFDHSTQNSEITTGREILSGGLLGKVEFLGRPCPKTLLSLANCLASRNYERAETESSDSGT